MKTDYTTVTEVPGSKVTQEQLMRLFNRYQFTSGFCEAKDVLEVACGSGIGLGYLAKKANKVVGTDICEENLKLASKHYKGIKNIETKRMDAHKLQFKEESFDVIILYEAIYYLKQPQDFVEEARRVLRENGTLIICTVNKDWEDFNPSPYSIKYFSAPELFSLLKQEFPKVELYGAFSVARNTTRDKIVSLVKRMAVNLHLIPKTMKRKEFLKRIFFGKLITLPSEIKEGMVEYCQPVPISCNNPNFEYKILFAVGEKRLN